MNSRPTFDRTSEEQPSAAIATVSKDDYRNAMATLGAAVNIITTDGPAGKAGFAATAVCSVSDTPPTLLVCLNRSSSVYEAVTENAAVCVNVLAGHHDGLSNLFGGKTPMEERFASAAWHKTASGAFALEDALTSFDCRITQSQDIGTHRVLYCTVLSVAGSGGTSALIYQGRKYHSIGGTQD